MTRVEAIAALELRRARGLRVATPYGMLIDVDSATECQLAYICLLDDIPERFEDDADVLRARIYAKARLYWLGVLASSASNRERMRAQQSAQPQAYE